MAENWTVPPESRPACPLSGRPCQSWTCLADVCAKGPFTPEQQRAEVRADRYLSGAILIALCRRAGLSLESDVDPGTPARNYELALRLGIGSVFGLNDAAVEDDS